MPYQWSGMMKVPWEDIKDLHAKGELAGYYQLYPDNTESQITSDCSLEDLSKHHDAGGEFGYEKTSPRKHDKHSLQR